VFYVYCLLIVFFLLIVYSVCSFLQYFDAVGWVFSPVKPSPV